MTETLSRQLAKYREDWHARVPTERQVVMDQHVAQLAASGIARNAKQVGDYAPGIKLRDQFGKDFDVATLLTRGPVVVTFYRGGWCPFCNFELSAHQAVLPRIAAAAASLVAISPEKPEDTVSTAEKNNLRFPVLSDIGHNVGKAFGVLTPLPKRFAPSMTDSSSTYPRRMGFRTTGRRRSRRLM